MEIGLGVNIYSGVVQVDEHHLMYSLVLLKYGVIGSFLCML